MTRIKYYPGRYTKCEPLHAVNNWRYVRRLIRLRKKGVKINPILIEGQRGGGCLLAGTHRSAANDIMMMLGMDEDLMIDVVSTEEVELSEDLREAIAQQDYELVDDLYDRVHDVKETV